MTGLEPVLPVTTTSTGEVAAEPAGTVASMVVGDTNVTPVAGREPNVTVSAASKPEPVIVTRPPPLVGPWLATTELTRGDTKVNTAAASDGLVPAAVPVVVTVTVAVPPTVTFGEMAVIDVGEDAVTVAVTPPKRTTGVPVPNPVPVMVTGSPPSAGPDDGLSPVTVGQPAAEPDTRPSRAPAFGLPHPVARSYPGPAEYCEPPNRLLSPRVTSLKSDAAPEL